MMHPTTFNRVSDNQPVEGELHDNLALDDFFDAEESWAQERVRVVRDCVKAGVGDTDIPQTAHWNWSRKSLKLRQYLPSPLSPFRLFGAKADNQWQGLMLACCLGYRSWIHTEPRDVVYVELLEVAPWNWTIEKAARIRKFRGIGRQLFELAVHWSNDSGFKGRVGLHSLRQSESFYADECHMKDFGPDPTKQPPMRYFELSEEAAKEYLEE